MMASRLAAVWLTVTAVVPVPVTHQKYDRVKLGDASFAVPHRYLSGPAEIPSWLKNLPGLESPSRELIVRIPGTEIVQWVPGYKLVSKSEYMQILLIQLSKSESEYYNSPSKYDEMWSGVGSYESRKVELNSKYGYFDVSRSLEYGKLWNVTRIQPGVGMIPSDPDAFWIASCNRLSSGDVICKSTTLYDLTYIQFTVADRNLDQVDSIRRVLQSKVQEWLKRGS